VVKVNCKKYSLKELCEMYIRMIATKVDGRMRVELHECIAERIGIDYDKLKTVLHNLDKEIGFEIKEFYTIREIKQYGNKLYERLIRFAKDEVLNDGDSVEFLKSIGMDIDEWEAYYRDYVNCKEGG